MDCYDQLRHKMKKNLSNFYLFKQNTLTNTWTNTSVHRPILAVSKFQYFLFKLEEDTFYMSIYLKSFPKSDTKSSKK